MAKITLRLYNGENYEKGSLRSLTLAFSSMGKTYYAPTGIQLKLNQWDSKRCIIIKHPDAANLTLKVTKLLLQAQEVLMKITGGYPVDIEAKILREMVMQELNKGTTEQRYLIYYMRMYAETKSKKNTKSVFNSTISRLLQYSSTVQKLMFDAINPMWLRQFDKWLSENGCPSVNGRSVHLRNIRTVFNAAIDDGITQNYPFRKFRIKNEQRQNVGISVSALRSILNLNLEGNMKAARDCFLLSFYMIGINMADLMLLDITGTKVIYNRQKTGKLYEFRLQPEAKELLYILEWARHYKNTHSLVMMVNRYLKQVGKMVGIDTLTTYDARYTWANIAAGLDIPKETIAQALGHTKPTVTDVYITFDRNKVDNANRMVIDYILNIK
jgi:integrase